MRLIYRIEEEKNPEKIKREKIEKLVIIKERVENK